MDSNSDPGSPTPEARGGHRLRVLPSRIAGILLVIAAMSGCRREPAVDRDPVSRMLDALGGPPAIAGLSSLAVEADCTGPSGAFRTRVQSLRPGRVYFEQSAGSDTTRLWSTPERTWTLEEGEPKSVPEGVRAFMRGHEFHLLLFEIESRFSERGTKSEETVDGRPVRTIRMTDEGGQPAALRLEKETFLPFSLELAPPGAAGPVTVYFGEWRRIGDLHYFESFRLTEGPDRVFSYRYSTISPNSVNPGLFSEPAGLGASAPD